MDPEKKVIIIQLKIYQGKGCPDYNVKESLKQVVSIPNNTTYFDHKLNNFEGDSLFYFSDNSIMLKKISNLQGHMMTHPLAYESS